MQHSTKSFFYANISQKSKKPATITVTGFISYLHVNLGYTPRSRNEVDDVLYTIYFAGKKGHTMGITTRDTMNATSTKPVPAFT